MPDWENMTAAELGEMYYLYTDPNTTWDDVAGHLPFPDSAPYHYPTIEAAFWDHVYGFEPEMYQYMPQDLTYGPYELSMLDRQYDLDVIDMNLNKEIERDELEQSYGSTGFSGSGANQFNMQNLWNTYQLQNQGLLSGLESSKRSIYETQGTAINRMIEDLSLEGLGS